MAMRPLLPLGQCGCELIEPLTRHAVHCSRPICIDHTHLSYIGAFSLYNTSKASWLLDLALLVFADVKYGVKT